MKQSSAFYPPRLLVRARTNARNHPWAAAIRDRIARAAQPWTRFSDEKLWGMMFGSTISRSWMVWSNGHCPACRKPVPMYTWKMDPLKRPWKVWCPHCGEVFPKNDFARFYRSGLDRSGVFDPTRADRRLLFNAEHPDPADRLRGFGVDDGEGYVAGGRRWRFIGAYLIYGQWKRLVLGGISRLAAAHVVTGDALYAHKAGVLLDRVADLYPTFDFGTQGLVYERRGDRGYVSTWHDACPETRALALAYDQVFEALKRDRELVAFLGEKAHTHGLANPKATFADVQRNIEGRICRDVIANRRKIASPNYPETETTVLVCRTVLHWPGNREAVCKAIDAIARRASAVDGLTGEKGLSGYSRLSPQNLAALLETYARVDAGFLDRRLQAAPTLKETWRFHIDTWCLGRYYPPSGDAGAFAARADRYCGVRFDKQGQAGGPWGLDPLAPSASSFLWRLHRLTGDADYARVIFHANGNSTAGLPHDIFAADPAGLRKGLADVIQRHGAELTPPSVNKRQWHIAILRSGSGNRRRAVWLDYDSGCGNHSHADGMTLGLYARGLDLMPDFGYPPVQFGGWGSQRSRWYAATAAHNTVAVDGGNHRNAPGRTTLWADGQRFRAVRASGAAIIAGRQFERTAALVDLSETDCYVLDVFRVVGGKRHARIMHGHFGKLTAAGLSLSRAGKDGPGELTRNWRIDANAAPGWQVRWDVDDRRGYLPPKARVGLRYTDLTSGAAAALGEAWIAPKSYNAGDQTWVPRVETRRHADQAPLASTFVGVIEPCGEASNIAGVRRLDLLTADGRAYGDANVAVEVALADGRRDLIVAADVENPLALTPPARDRVIRQPDWALHLDGELCWVRRGADGTVRRIALCRGRSVRAGDVAVRLKKKADFIEVVLDGEAASVVSGEPEDVESITVPARKGR